MLKRKTIILPHNRYKFSFFYLQGNNTEGDIEMHFVCVVVCSNEYINSYIKTQLYKFGDHSNCIEIRNTFLFGSRIHK